MRTLKKLIAVQTGPQFKMPAEKRFRLPQNVEYVRFVHLTGSITDVVSRGKREVSVCAVFSVSARGGVRFQVSGFRCQEERCSALRRAMETRRYCQKFCEKGNRLTRTVNDYQETDWVGVGGINRPRPRPRKSSKGEPPAPFMATAVKRGDEVDR